MMIGLHQAGMFLGHKVVEMIVLNQVQNFLDLHLHKKIVQPLHMFLVDKEML